MYNIPTADKQRQAGSRDATSAERTIEMALAAHSTVQEVIRHDAYLLPDEVRSRLEAFFLLLGQATFAVLKDQQVSPDVNAYGRYLDLSLQAVVRGEEVPAHVEPPNLSDVNRPQWIPDQHPARWT